MKQIQFRMDEWKNPSIHLFLQKNENENTFKTAHKKFELTFHVKNQQKTFAKGRESKKWA